MEFTSVTADVEISIVSLRGGPVLDRCLATLACGCKGLDWRLSLVDNSPAGLHIEYSRHGIAPGVVVRSEGRRGFGGNQNLALETIVCERRARYVLILNDDVELDAHAVTAMVRHADRDPHAGVVGPLVRNADGSCDPPLLAWPTLANQTVQCLLPRWEVRASPRDGWITGSCMLVRTAALAAVGLFDPRYFLFFEETDLCRRMTRAGWRVEHCGDASILHQKHQTTKHVGLDITIEQQFLRSRYLYIRKHYGRLAARSLDGSLRCAFLARAAKAALEAVLGRVPMRSSPLGTLWALTISRPSRPTGLEIEAGARQ